MKNILSTLAILMIAVTSQSQIECPTPISNIETKVTIDPNVITPTIHTDSLNDGNDFNREGNFQKTVFWIHGMGGDESSWDSGARYAREEYEVKGFKPDYNNSQTTLDNAAASLTDQIEDKWAIRRNFITEENDYKSFGVGHSLGAIVLRKASADYEFLEDGMMPGIHGMVSFNGPHGGSNLAKYVDINGSGDLSALNELETFLSETCNAFVDPQLYEIAQLNLGQANTIFGILGPLLLNASSISETFCDSLAGLGTPLAIGNIATPAVKDLDIGSSALDINENIPSNRKMLIATDILDDSRTSAFKMFYSAFNNPNNSAQFDAEPYHSEEALRQYEKKKSKFDAKRLEFKSHYDNKPWWKTVDNCVFTIGFNLCFTYRDARNLRNLNRAAVNQFNIINDFWEVMCGAKTYEINNLGSCHCLGLQDVTHDITQFDCYDLTCDDINIPIWKPYPVQTKTDPYDGFITVESQRAWDINENYKLTFSGPNHKTIRNSYELMEALDILFTGRGPAFFGE